MNLKSIPLLCILAFAVAGCHRGPAPRDKAMPISLSQPAKGDSVIYGLACVGCTDSVVVLLPNAGGDPVTFNILEAKRMGRIYGTPDIGDWLGVLPRKKGSKTAYSVVDLDELKGSWTYPVMPHLRDVSHLSKRQQARILANMPDSIVETYMIPRQYGFTLKRLGEARSIGRVPQANTLEDDSPVEYPSVPFYTEWHPYNNRLILIQGKTVFQNTVLNAKEKRDTLEFVYLKDDSLALRNREGKIIGFHRQANSRAANAKAEAAAAKQAQKAQQQRK